MKALLKVFTVLIAMMPLATTYANTDEPVFKLKQQGEKTLAFEMKAFAKDNVEIIFETSNGEQVFSEYLVRPVEFERIYNLEALKKGDYFIRVKYGSKTQLLPIKLTATGIELNFGDLVSI